MFTCNECMRNYPTLESLKRHLRYAHIDNRVKCRWCPYDVSSNATYRMRHHEKSKHWYKFKDESKENQKTPTKKIPSVVKKVEKKKKKKQSSTNSEATKLPSAECPPLREPSPMTVEFEELMATKHTTPTEDLLFALPVIAVAEDQERAKIATDNIKESDGFEIEKGTVVMDDQSVPVSEDIQEPDETVISERPGEDTVTEVREQLVRSHRGRHGGHQEDIRVVEIDGMTPTPNYLPSRITPTHLKFGKIYDYRHFGLPEEKDNEDPRQARRNNLSTTILPDGYSGLIKTERCELPDGTVYSLTSHWVPDIPVRRYKTTGVQASTTPETRDENIQVTPVTTLSGTQTEEMAAIVKKTFEDKESSCDIIAYHRYKMCSICLKEFEEKDKLWILPCEHEFHVDCITPWLRKKKTELSYVQTSCYCYA
ncbi:unnamed protein product [Mytilus edulis]|uniref:C2H2-type domain-containing protein n=1 Tax=Mytilus edulis TaxID=6550 RepID=A0A8S3QT08_MYTED|nr:unnamed protein product [Mytilus edulis]